MLARIRSLLFTPEAPLPDADPLPAAAAALLIEAAVMDGDFDADERAVIADLLGRRFDLEPGEVATLIEDGERAVAQSVELYGTTRVLKDGLDHQGRLEVMEMLWQVVWPMAKMHSR